VSHCLWPKESSWCQDVSENEFKWIKIYVKMSNFYNLFLHMFRWCQFNGMLIMVSSTWSLKWMLWNLNWIITCSNFEFWFEVLINKYIQHHYFHKRSFNFHNTNLLIFKKQFSNWGVLNTSKKHSKLPKKIYFLFSKILRSN
jgi:hypothetical protein